MIEVHVVDVRIHAEKVFHQKMEVLLHQGTIPTQIAKEDLVCHQFYGFGWKKIFSFVACFWTWKLKT